jgi:hypothetical protein
LWEPTNRFPSIVQGTAGKTFNHCWDPCQRVSVS